MTDVSYSDNPATAADAPPDGVDLTRTPLAGDPFDSARYDPAALKVDLYGNPVDRNPYFPDPNDPTLDIGQVLYHLAFGAKPEDFHPAVQPLAQGLSIGFEPQPPLGPGLLGSLEDIRAAAAAAPAPAASDDQGSPDGEGANHADVMPAAAGSEPSLEHAAAKLSDRDRNYLDRYYDPVAKYAEQYQVNPAFVLGLGIESSFGTQGTYKDTGDAFGMTGGSTENMTTATSPEDNVRKFFGNFGPRIRGVGDDADAFINALQGRDSQRRPISGVKPYNSVRPVEWEKMARDGIGQMRRDLPIYLPMRAAKRSTIGSDRR